MAEELLYDVKITGVANAKQSIEELTRLQIQQQDAIKETQKEIKDYEKKLKEFQDQVKDGKALSEEQIELEKLYNENLINSKLSLAEQKDELKVTNSIRNEAVKDVEKLNTVINAEAGSNEQLSASLALKRKEYNLLSQEERENTVAGQELTQEIKNITEKLKENESAIGDNRRNVGNYEQAVTNALGKVELFGVNIGDATKQVIGAIDEGKKFIAATIEQSKTSLAAAGSEELRADATTKANLATKLASKGLNVFKLAVIGSGVGILVAGILAVVAALQKFQPLMDKASIVLSQVGQVVNVLVDRFALFGKGLISIASGNFGKGFDEIKQSTAGLNDELEREIELAGRLKSQLIELERSQAILNVAVTQARAKIKELQNVYNDTNASLEEKNKATQEAIKLQKEITQAEINQQKALIANAFGYDTYNDKVATFVEKIQDINNIYKTSEERARLFNVTLKNLGLDLSTAAETEDFIKMINDLSSVTLSGEEALKRLGGQSMSLTNQLNNTFKKQQEDANKAAEEIRKAEEARIEAINDYILTEEERIVKDRDAKLAELGLLKEITELTDNELTARLLIEEEYNKKSTELEQAKFEKELLIRELAFNKVEDSLKAEYNLRYVQALQNGEDLEALDKEFNDKKIQRQKDFIQNELSVLQAQLQEQSASLSIGDQMLSEDKTQALQNRIDVLVTKLRELGQASTEAITDPETGKPRNIAEALGLNEDQTRDIQASYAAVTNGIMQITQMMSQQLTQNTNDRIAAIDQALKDGVIDEAEAAKQKEKIQADSFKQQKKLNKTQATINYLNGIIAAISNAMQLGPIAGPIVGAINAAIVSAAYAKNIQGIEQAKYADGGYVQGVGGSRTDHINAKLSNGEYVQNAKAVSYYGKDFMDSLNSLNIPKFANGGFVTPMPTQSIGEQVGNSLQPIVNEAINREIRVINIESEFTKVQNKANYVKQAATY